jgi:hypothetical protein
MEAIFSSETSVDFQQITRRYIPEDSISFLVLICDISSYFFNFNFFIKHSGGGGADVWFVLPPVKGKRSALND